MTPSYCFGLAFESSNYEEYNTDECTNEEESTEWTDCSDNSISDL